MIPICLFFGEESERNKQKKNMIQKFVWKKKKNVRIHDDDFFRKNEIICTEKKHNCFFE